MLAKSNGKIISSGTVEGAKGAACLGREAAAGERQPPPRERRGTRTQPRTPAPRELCPRAAPWRAAAESEPVLQAGVRSGKHALERATWWCSSSWPWRAGDFEGFAEVPNLCREVLASNFSEGSEVRKRGGTGIGGVRPRGGRRSGGWLLQRVSLLRSAEGKGTRREGTPQSSIFVSF